MAGRGNFSLKFMVYCGFASCMIASIYYDEHIIPSTSARKIGWGGKWKYLTHLNLWLQPIYWTVVVLAGLSTFSYDDRKRRGTLHKLMDVIHSSLAFPVGMFVCITFWMIYAVDRELVYPKRLDAIIPTWLNHVMHTVHVPFLLIDKFMVKHQYPTNITGQGILLFFAALYQCWILYLALIKEIWVYPILEVMNWTYRMVFFVLLWAFFLLLYRTGALVTAKMHRPVAHKKK